MMDGWMHRQISTHKISWHYWKNLHPYKYVHVWKLYFYYILIEFTIVVYFFFSNNLHWHLFICYFLLTSAGHGDLAENQRKPSTRARSIGHKVHCQQVTAGLKWAHCWQARTTVAPTSCGSCRGGVGIYERWGISVTSIEQLWVDLECLLC